MGTVLSVFWLGDKFPDVFGLVHQPVEGRHLELPLKFIAHCFPNPGIVLVQPFFLNGNVYSPNCTSNWKLKDDSPREDLEDSCRWVLSRRAPGWWRGRPKSCRRWCACLQCPPLRGRSSAWCQTGASCSNQVQRWRNTRLWTHTSASSCTRCL